jgi:hypothetical protein
MHTMIRLTYGDIDRIAFLRNVLLSQLETLTFGPATTTPDHSFPLSTICPTRPSIRPSDSVDPAERAAFA